MLTFGRRTGLVTGRSILGGIWAGALAGGLTVAAAVLRPVDGLFNDYYDYWGAARILNMGGNPYDVRALSDVLAAAGVHSTIGRYGFSYPALVAELMRPLGLLPAEPSAVVFSAVSVVGLAVAMALLLPVAAPDSMAESLGLATGAALFAPVLGSLYVGQVNLILLPLLVLALRGVGRPVTIGVVSAVKLYPLAAAAAFAGQRRRGLRPAIVTLALALALVMAGGLLAGAGSYGRSVVRMFGPDPYWTNASINGWLSRLAIASQETTPPLPWLPVTASMLAIGAVLGALSVLLIAWRRSPWEGAFALMICFVVVASPKGSLWNFTPLLLPLLACWAVVRRRPRQLGLLLAAWALIELQGITGFVRVPLYAGRPALTWLTGLAVAGALLAGGLVAHTLLSGAPAAAGAWRPAPVLSRGPGSPSPPARRGAG